MRPETSVYEYARHRFAKPLDKTALWFYGRSMTFGELFSRVDAASAYLYSIGVGADTVVTIHLPNCPQAVVAFYAVARLGAICNMVHAQVPAYGVKELMTLADSRLLITHCSECARISPEAILVNVLSGETAADTPQCPALSLDNAFKENSYGEIEVPSQASLAQKCAVYLHSSGSTGRPKTIMLSHSALNYCVEATADFFEDQIDSYVSLGVLPQFHGFGLAMDVHRNISFGSKLIQMIKWDAGTAVQLIKEHRVSLMVGVPTMYYSLLRRPEFSGEGISCLKKCYVGGDNVKTELIREFDERVGGGHHMFAGYGLTEATTTDFVNTYLHYKEGSCGYPTRYTAAAVIDKDGNIAYRGDGELIISSKTLMMGYLHDSEETKKTLLYAEGKLWTRTGDFVTLDDDGFLFFRDRYKNIIIHNGYNIYPTQLEDVIRTVPGVKDVCVIGVEDIELHTQNVKAVIIADERLSNSAVEHSIRARCNEMLPRYAQPKMITFVSSFPCNAMGKVDRIRLGITK